MITILLLINYLAVFSNKPIVKLDFNTGAELMYKMLICEPAYGRGYSDTYCEQSQIGGGGDD